MWLSPAACANQSADRASSLPAPYGTTRIEAKGKVYGFKCLRDFRGVGSAQARYGFALGPAGVGDLYLYMQNANAVVTLLQAGSDAEPAR